MASVEYQVREARLTDIDQIGGLIQRADRSWDDQQLSVAADLLRQLLYMPSATVMVAVDGRQVEGLAVLSLRPSIAARGLVGTIDLLAIEPGHELAGAIEVLLREIIRSARNKGCVVLDAGVPGEPAVLAALEHRGFTEDTGRLSLSLAGAKVGAR
jgi:N-acetylglutamate synthase-like GNAT family acetyltransferase